MDVKPPLTHSIVSRSLNAACYAFASVLTEGETDLTTEWVDNYLPGLVFTLALESGWIAEPSAPFLVSEALPLGEYFVTKQDRDELIGMISASLVDLRAIAGEDEPPPKAIAPTRTDAKENPEQLLRRRKKEMGVSWTKLSLIASKHRKAQAEADVKAGIVYSRANTSFKVDTIYRILKGRNATPENTKALAAAIGCDYAALCWPEE